MTTNQTNERVQLAAEEIGRLVDDTCSTNEDFAAIIAKHFPNEGMESELAEALRRALPDMAGKHLELNKELLARYDTAIAKGKQE